MAENILCDARDLFFRRICTDGTKIQGQWQRDFLDEKISRKKEEEDGSFSQDSRATTAALQDIEGEEFFNASDTIDEGDWKSEGDDVFWDSSDKKSKEWQETVQMGYRQQSSEKKKAPKVFLCRRRKE